MLPCLVIPIAFLLDLILGDPDFSHHPIRWMGNLISWLESRIRHTVANELMGGMIMVATLVPGTWAVTWSILQMAHEIDPLCEWVLEIVLIYFTISASALEKAAMAVYRPLIRGQVSKARNQLAMIVGRDVTRLSEAGMARAAVETVAENLVDGVMAPLFYAALGGAPLAMTYKMINTLDSMIGYKTGPYRRFGRFAARLDDVANYIPARLAVAIIALAAAILTGNGSRAITVAFNEGRCHASPNSGFPEAAFAGVFKIWLGGPNWYHGELVDKPRIGSCFGPTTADHIPKACDLMIVSASLWMLLAWGLDWVL